MTPNDGVDIAGTVRERAARELRDRILTGALPAGTRLDLDAITKEFATSRTPVREALLELSYDGLVRVAILSRKRARPGLRRSHRPRPERE